MVLTDFVISYTTVCEIKKVDRIQQVKMWAGQSQWDTSYIRRPFFVLRVKFEHILRFGCTIITLNVKTHSAVQGLYNYVNAAAKPYHTYTYPDNPSPLHLIT